MLLSIFTETEQQDKMDDNQLVNLTFEDFGNESETIFWWASDLMQMLGYPNMGSFINPINRAMQACLSASIDTHDNFVRTARLFEGREINDYKLTRFACYMVAMNGDTKKPQVSAAQAYFAKTVEQVNLLLEGSNDVERIVLRGEVKAGNKSLAAAAKAAGVSDVGRFWHFSRQWLHRNV